jgi:putative membrane protein
VRTSRWPSWVYGAGDEPDYRFSFANERTFLAWIRTALALIAGGVALDALDLSMSPGVQRGLAAALTVLGALCAGLSWTRWALAERAVRRNEPLPASSLSVLVAVAVVVVAIVILVAGI